MVIGQIGLLACYKLIWYQRECHNPMNIIETKGGKIQQGNRRQPLKQNCFNTTNIISYVVEAKFWPFRCWMAKKVKRLWPWAEEDEGRTHGWPDRRDLERTVHSWSRWKRGELSVLRTPWTIFEKCVIRLDWSVSRESESRASDIEKGREWGALLMIRMALFWMDSRLSTLLWPVRIMREEQYSRTGRIKAE